MATIAVTGGTGLLGQSLVPLLLHRGHTVRLLSRPRPATRRVTPVGAILVEGSLTDEAALDRLVDGADCILHAAYAEPGPATDSASTQRWFDENFLGTMRLLERTVRTRDQQLIYTSSLAVFSRDPNLDPRGDTLLRDEECALLPLEFYGSLRAACEQLLRTAAHTYQLNTSCWRLGCVLGLRDPWTTSPLFSTVDEAVRTGEIRSPFGAYSLAVEDAATLLADAVGDASLRGQIVHTFDRWIDHASVVPMLEHELGRPICNSCAKAPEPRSPIRGEKVHARYRGWRTEASLRALVRELVARCRERTH